MPFSYAPLSEEAVDIHEVTGDGENNGQFEFPVPDNTRHVAVLLEKITGDVDFQVKGHDNENISTTPNERAELYVYRPFIGVRNVSVRILSKLNSRFKVTVAFFKSAIGAESTASSAIRARKCVEFWWGRCLHLWECHTLSG